MNNLITKQSHIGSLSPKLPRIAFHLIYWILYRETLLWENPLACQNTTDYDVDALTCLNCTFISINSRQKAFDCRCVCGVFKTFFFGSNKVVSNVILGLEKGFKHHYVWKLVLLLCVWAKLFWKLLSYYTSHWERGWMEFFLCSFLMIFEKRKICVCYYFHTGSSLFQEL